MADWSDNPWAVAGVLGVTLMTAIGFLIGPMADYSAHVNVPGEQRQGNQDFDGTLPNENYQRTGFNMNSEEQMLMAYENDVAFITVITSENSTEIEGLEQLVSDWDQRVYISQTSLENSDLATGYGLTEEETPFAMIIGSSGETPEQAFRELQGDDITVENLNQAVCEVIVDWEDQSVNCV